MAFVKKPLGTLLLGSGGLGIVHISGGFGTSTVSSNSIDSKSNLDQIKQKISDVSDFLKIGNTSTTQSDLVKEYVLTLSGAKDFARILVGSLIIDLVDNLPDGQASAIQKSIKNRLDSIRLNSAPTGKDEEKNETYQLYGGEDKYKSYHALNAVRKIAIEELSSYLPTFLSSATDDLKGASYADDLIKNGFGLFYDKLLDDYIAFSKPIFVKRFFFNYKTESIEDEAKKLFDPSSLPSDFVYPKKANYLFPYVKSDEKWSSLKSSTISTTEPSEQNSDDHKNGKLVIPLTMVENSQHSSQFIAAALKLQSKSTSTEQLSTVKILDNSSTQSSKVDEIKHLKDDVVFFRDHRGIHVLVKDSTKNTPTDTKKHLIAAAKNTSDSDYKFDLQGELQKWMEKHFERIFLSEWENIKNKQDTHKQNLEKYKDAAEKLKSILESIMLKDTLIQLRKNLIKDYAALVEKFPPQKWGGKMQPHPWLKFAGKFDGKPNTDTSAKLKEVQLVYKDLENALLNTTGQTTVRTEYNTKLTDKYSEFSTQVSNLVSTNTNDLVSTPDTDNESKKKLYIFKPSAGDDKHLLNVTNFFNNLWIHMIHDGSAESHLFQKQLRSYVDKHVLKKDNSQSNSNDIKSIFESFKTSELEKSETLKNISQDIFKDDSLKQDFSKVLFRRIIVSRAKEALKSSVDPAIYAKDLLHKLSDLKDTSSLETIVKNLNTFYGDEGYDALSHFQKDLLAEIATIEFLSRNNFNNLRKLLKHKFAKGLSASFIFSKKYEANGMCSPDVNKLDEALTLDHKKVLAFNNELLGHTGNGSVSWSSENCLTKDEFFDFAILKSNAEFTGDLDIKGGYKGLVFSDKYSEVVSEDVADLLKKLPIWSKPETIVKYIKEIKTESSFSAIITQLKDFFPHVSWSFVEEKQWINPRADYKNKHSSSSSLSLDQRKNILAGFISQQTNTVDKDSSLKHKHDKQKAWASSGKQHTGANSFLKDKLSRHNGYFTHNNSKLITDVGGNKHLVYLIQMKYDDLQDKTSWEQFLKEMSPDLIADELVKLAKDKSLQKQVTYHLLNETDDKGIDRMKIGDTRLRDKLGVTWISLA